MTQSARDYLKSQYDKLLAESEAITTAAEAEGRSVTAEEREKANALIEQAAGHMKSIKSMKETEDLRESINRMQGAFNEPSEEAPEGAKTLGDAFVKSDSYKALVAGGFTGGKWTTGPVELPEEFGLGAKATLTQAASAIAQPDVQPGIQLINQRRLTVADLLASGTTSTNTVRYLEETTATNAADSVAEEGAKPESTLILDEVDEPVRKIATILPVSDEMLEDEAQIRSYIDARLRLFVQQVEEDQLVSGSGTAPDLEGILNRTGIQTDTRANLQTASGASDSTEADAVFQAITEIQVNALAEPDGVIFHPANWAVVRLLKDTAGQYFGGGPFTGAYGNSLSISQNSIWGLNAVVTTGITENTALVGAFATQAQVFRRGGITVEASNSHSDFFATNKTAIRAEERLALAVYRPAAFHAITAFQTDPV